jgi:hypothetical protein
MGMIDKEEEKAIKKGKTNHQNGISNYGRN